MGVNIKGGNNSLGLANVSSTYELQVVTPQEQAQAGFVQLSSEIDDGTVLGTRTLLATETSDDYRLRVGLDQTMFNMTFEGATFCYGQMQTIATTQTIAQQNNFMVLNSNATLTNSTACYLRSLRHFPTFGTYPTYLDMWIKESNPTSQNAISEWGFLYLLSPTTQAPLDGIFFRRLSGGALRAVINYGGVETEYTIDVTNVPSRDGVGAYDPNEVSHYLIAYHNDVVRFWINDILVASIDCPSNQQSFTISSNTPIGMRVFHAGVGSITVARQILIGYINVGYGDQNVNKPWGHVLAGAGHGAYQAPTGTTSGQLSFWQNSVAPPTVTPSNTAAGYTYLGGQWLMASQGAQSAAEADWIMYGYQVPPGTTSNAGRSLYITNIRIGETVALGTVAGAVFVGVTAANIFQWAVAANSSAVSLATLDGGASLTTTTGPRRIPLGIQAFQPGISMGALAPGFAVDFNSAPIVCPAGTYFHVIMKQISGTSTTSLNFRGTVTAIGYWE
jgi:hypothetical protein